MSSVVVIFSHFRLPLWNRWTEFNKTWQEARSQRPPRSFCFSGRSKKTRWPPRPLIGWYIFDLSSETAERHLTKLDRKQDPIVLYQVFFGPIGKTTWHLIGWDILNFSSETAERNLTKLNRKQDHNASTKFLIFGSIGKTRWPPRPLIGWDIFDFSSETAERNSTKLDKKQDHSVLYPVCVFQADRRNEVAALAILSKSGTLYSSARYVALLALVFLYRLVQHVITRLLSEKRHLETLYSRR